MARSKMSDILTGGFQGGGAGLTGLGALMQTGKIGAGAMSPWAWGLIGGGAGLGALSNLFADDEEPKYSPEEAESLRLSNILKGQDIDMGKYQLGQARESRTERRRKETSRKGFSGRLGTMFKGSRMAQPVSSATLTGGA